jgi:hemoglobin-like flavoprotein
MTPAQIRTIRASFVQKELALSQLSHKFYDRLFAAAPELRALLGDDKQQQLAKAVSELVHSRSAMAFPAVPGSEAASRPSERRPCGGINISREYLNVMRRTLLEVVQEELGEHYTDSVGDAWRAAFDVLSRAMLDSVANLPKIDDSFFDRLSSGTAADRAAAVPASRAAALDEFFR